MKKLEKLSLKELRMSSTVLDSKETSGLVGGGAWIWSPENGWTYLMEDVNAVDFYSPEHPALDSITQTFCDFTLAGSCNFGNQAASALISAIPFLGDFFGVISNKFNCERSEATHILLRNGYNCNDSIKFNTVVGDDYSIYFDLYTPSGKFIGTTK